MGKDAECSVWCDLHNGRARSLNILTVVEVADLNRPATSFPLVVGTRATP